MWCLVRRRSGRGLGARQRTQKVVHARPIVERVQVEPAGAPPAGAAAAAGVSIAGHFFNNLRVLFVCKMEEE